MYKTESKEPRSLTTLVARIFRYIVVRGLSFLIRLLWTLASSASSLVVGAEATFKHMQGRDIFSEEQSDGSNDDQSAASSSHEDFKIPIPIPPWLPIPSFSIPLFQNGFNAPPGKNLPFNLHSKLESPTPFLSLSPFNSPTSSHRSPHTNPSFKQTHQFESVSLTHTRHLQSTSRPDACTEQTIVQSSSLPVTFHFLPPFPASPFQHPSLHDDP